MFEEDLEELENDFEEESLASDSFDEEFGEEFGGNQEQRLKEKLAKSDEEEIDF